jgi:hypothetical protein
VGLERRVVKPLKTVRTNQISGICINHCFGFVASDTNNGELEYVSVERRAESGEQSFEGFRAEIFGLNLDRKWVYYRGLRGY